MSKGKGDLHPHKAKAGKSIGGTHCSRVDNDTRTILHMDIGPKTLRGAGSGKITKDINGAMAQANKKMPKR